jgi:hypothetical protein
MQTMENLRLKLSFYQLQVGRFISDNSGRVRAALLLAVVTSLLSAGANGIVAIGTRTAFLPE